METRAHGIQGQRAAWLIAAAVLVLTALAACGPQQLLGKQKTLQHDGGIQITFSLACPSLQAGCDIQRLSAQTRDILQQRAVNGLGVADAVTRLDGNTAIVVELPAYTDNARALAVLGQRGEVDFIDSSGSPIQIADDVSTKLCTDACTPGQYKILFTGAQLDPNAISATLDPQSQQPTVTFAFAQPYQQQFAEYTRQHIGQYLTIALDGKVIESATIQSEIDSQGQITGLANMDTAQALVTNIKYHALPLAVTATHVELVTPPTTT
ncbi:MAG: SecDF P1 head subdomain-containing protein [Ktedonobacterales bacterium]